MGMKRRAFELETQTSFKSCGKNRDVVIIECPERGTVARDDHRVSSCVRPDQEGRFQKLDVSKMRQCSTILKKLMAHPAGWVFSHPVDPVKLKIPDYFSIISKPMDLGTIKDKLERKLYSSTDQFAADVRLTFSNAMQYNSPGNEVHILAKELNAMFMSQWKSLEEKWGKDHSVSQEKPPNLERGEHKQTSRRIIIKRSASSTPMLSRRSPTDPAKLKLSNDHAKIPVKNIPSKVILSSIDVGGMKVSSKPSIAREKCQKGSHTGRKSHSCEVVMVRAPEAGICRATQTSGEGVFGGKIKTNLSPSSPNATSAEGDDHWPLDEPLSPNKALRAAMLKSRFADTIVKAQQKALLNHGEKIDSAKLHFERQKLERKQKEEKARIEAQVKAVQEAAIKEEAQLRLQREQEREAARLALQKMEKTVDINENVNLSKELEHLGYLHYGGDLCMPGGVVVNFVDGNEVRSNMLNPLEKLGLFMKIDLFDEDVDSWIDSTGKGDMEEGEIGSL